LAKADRKEFILDSFRTDLLSLQQGTA
jgi:hypothetical protein